MTTNTPNPFARYVTDDVVESAVRAATGAFYVGLYSSPYSVDNAMRSALLAALAIVGPEIRRDALEEAAEECERQKEISSPPQRARIQPLSILHERYAYTVCAFAIRALGKEG